MDSLTIFLPKSLKGLNPPAGNAHFPAFLHQTYRGLPPDSGSSTNDNRFLHDTNSKIIY